MAPTKLSKSPDVGIAGAGIADAMAGDVPTAATHQVLFRKANPQTHFKAPCPNQLEHSP